MDPLEMIFCVTRKSLLIGASAFLLACQGGTFGYQIENSTESGKDPFPFGSPTPVSTFVPSPTPTPGGVPPTPTPTPVTTVSPTPTPTPLITVTPTPTPTPVITVTPTPTPTPVITVTPTPTPTPVITVTPSPTPTPTITVTPTPTPTPIGSGAVQRASSAAIGDFNGDSIQDVTSTYIDETRPRISQLRGIGGGLMTEASEIAMPNDIPDQAAGDMDGDGILDLVVIDNYTNLVVLKGRGDGTFVRQSTMNVADGRLASAMVLELQDFNRDGRLDAIVSRMISYEAGSAIVIAFGTGAGGFSSTVEYAHQDQRDPWISAPPSFAVGDLNRDGWLDFVVTRNWQNVSVYHGGAGGIFLQTSEIALPSGREVSGLALGSLNPDANLDLAVLRSERAAGFTIGQTYVGNASGNFSPLGEIRTADINQVNFLHPVIADMNRDGLGDVMYTNRQSFEVAHRLHLLVNQGTGLTFIDQVYGLLGSPSRFDVKDVSGDGRLDVVIPNYSSATPPDPSINVSIFLGSPSGPILGVRRDY